MRGPCACLHWAMIMLPDGTQANRIATRTSTRPPPVPASAPCPYRTRADVSRNYPIRLSNIIRTGLRLLPSLVGKIHQDGGDIGYCIRLSKIIGVQERAGRPALPGG